jgi:hypothetical protein
VLRSTIEAAWYKFVNDNTESEVTVIFADESAPRPNKPYITLKIISGPNAKGFDDIRYINNTEFSLSGMRQYSLSIQGFGVDMHDALSKLQTILDSPNVIAQLKEDADIAIVNKGSVSDITVALETSFERRFNMDIIFNTSENLSITLDVIESTKIGGKLIKEDNTENIVDDFLVPNN